MPLAAQTAPRLQSEPIQIHTMSQQCGCEEGKEGKPADAYGWKTRCHPFQVGSFLISARSDLHL